MAKLVTTEWGRSLDILADLPEEQRKKAYSGGINYINPHGMIPLHFHENDSEEYVPQTEGIKILVVNEHDAEEMDINEILAKLTEKQECAIGDVIVCPKGCGHMAINTTDEKVALAFLKYKGE